MKILQFSIRVMVFLGKITTLTGPLRDSYIKHAGDDGIENDRNNSGRVSNVLIDSAFMGVSCRKENRTISGKSLTIENSLIALER